MHNQNTRHQFPRAARWAMALSVAAGVALQPSSGVAQQCEPIPPPTCEIDNQFLNGRWGISGISGSHELSGQETYQADADFDNIDPKYLIHAQVTGSLDVEMIGGPEENYLDIDCEGNVTGMATERISGRVLKTAVDPYICGPSDFDDADIDWDVTLDRSYRIEGSVSGAGELTVDFIVESATAAIDGYFVQEEDCFWTSWSDDFSEFDITGNEETESVRLSGGYDPVGFTFTPTVDYIGDPWVKQIANRLQTYFQPRPDMGGPDVDPPPFELLLHPSDWTPPDYYEQLEVMLQADIEITSDIEFESGPKTPVITLIELAEPSAYLSSVPVTTRAIATIDWRDANGTRTVDFTYGGITETISAAGDTAIFEFDAGDPGSTIDAVARADAEESQNYSLRVGKAELPSWAGSPGDWSGRPGVVYDGTVNWPISLETTRTVSALALFAGVFGIEGSASSEFNASAHSNGSPLNGDLNASASFKFAGKGSSLTMTGNTQTTLSCGELNTNGSATVTVPPANWQKTLNPITLIPGVSAAACSISGALCRLINSVGVKARAYGSVGGSANYEASDGPLQFTGGSVTGTLGGSVSASAVPRPLDTIAQVTISGGAGGCIEVQVPPEFMISTLGGELTASASLSLLGFGTSVSDTIPFGDGCGGQILQFGIPGLGRGTDGWVPADGNLAIALLPDDEPGDLAVAAWSEPRSDAVRPSGDFWLRVHDQGVWRTMLPITDDTAADVAPAVAMLDNGTAMLVGMRNESAIPASIDGVDAWAVAFDLHYWIVELSNGSVLQSGVLTGPGFDFGPQLVRDGDGGLNLYWQSASGAATSADAFGSSTAPSSLHHRRFDGSNWGASTVVASSLGGTFGWQASAFDTNTQAVALVLDLDEDLATEDDREIAIVERDLAGWNAPVLLTSDTTPDQAPSLTYDATGALHLLWRRGTEAWTLDGSGLPTLAFESPDPAFDDGIGNGFHAARVANGPAGTAVIWPDAQQLAISAQLAADFPSDSWSAPEEIAPDATAQSIVASRSNGGQLQMAWTTHPFNADGISLSGWITPMITSLPFGTCTGAPGCDDLFSDGFDPALQ